MQIWWLICRMEIVRLIYYCISLRMQQMLFENRFVANLMKIVVKDITLVQSVSYCMNQCNEKGEY